MADWRAGWRALLGVVKPGGLMYVGLYSATSRAGLVALRQLSAFSAQLAVSLEPVYAIVLAILLLGEQRELGIAFYAGVAIILGAVFAHTALKLRNPGA